MTQRLRVSEVRAWEKICTAVGWRVSFLALAGCATSRPRGDVVPEKELKVAWQDGYRGQGPKGPFTCRLETPTGSHQQQKVCRYDNDDADSVRRRLQMQDAMNQNALTGTPVRP